MYDFYWHEKIEGSPKDIYCLMTMSVSFRRLEWRRIFLSWQNVTKITGNYSAIHCVAALFERDQLKMQNWVMKEQIDQRPTDMAEKYGPNFKQNDSTSRTVLFHFIQNKITFKRTRSLSNAVCFKYVKYLTTNTVILVLLCTSLLCIKHTYYIHCGPSKNWQ